MPAKESLETLNNDLENYFRNTIIPQMFVDEQLVLRKFTPPAMKQFNLTNQDIGKEIHSLADNIRFRGMIENIEEVIATGEVLQKEIQTTDMRWYQMNILPYMVFATGKRNGVIITFVDITSRISDLKDLEKLIAEQQILLDTISHDIKTPITNINLALDMVSGPPEDMTAGIQIIQRSTAKIQSMIEDLVRFQGTSAISNTEAELLSFENILEDASLALTKQIKDAQAVIVKDIQVSQVLFSRRQLRSVVYNLVSNALKYRSPDRQCEIDISTYATDNGIAIEVNDNGIGIEKDKQEAVFAKHYRIQTGVEGTGMGLYLVKQIVRNAGGTISLQSEPGRGSAFTIHLPEK